MTPRGVNEEGEDPTVSPNKRRFTEEHLERLRLGAKRRNEEQLVGNFIRRSNRALFAKLLLEAQQPPSPTVDALADLLPTENGGGPIGDLGNPNSRTAPIGVLERAAPKPTPIEEPRRPPPPILDIK